MSRLDQLGILDTLLSRHDAPDCVGHQMFT
jgi:hypothetical protein